MKRIFLLLTMMTVYAVTLGQVSPRNPQIDEVDALCRRVDSLTQRISDKYATYTNDTVYYDLLYKKGELFGIGKSVQEKTFKEIATELKTMRARIKEKNDSIKVINQEIAWVDTLPAYYASHNLDELFEVTDFQILDVHREVLSVLGKEVPASIDQLQYMHKSADLLKREYDANATEECLGLLKKVPDCAKKKELQWLLEKHSAVTSETKSWIGNDEHTLYELMDFRKYLKDYYEVELEKHYPFLAEKARKTVGFTKE